MHPPDPAVVVVPPHPTVAGDLAGLFRRGPRRWTVLAILLLGLLVRIPGVFWGSNFPIDGFGLHHPDELTHWLVARNMLQSGATPANVPPYPKGTAVPVVLGIRAVQLATRTTGGPLPSRRSMILAGRGISVMYGTLTVLVILLLAQRFLSRWSSVVAAGVATALGGLHVSQSHFFLADAPALCWFALGLYLFRLHLEDDTGTGLRHFLAAAFAFGVAFGIKVVLLGIPLLAIGALLRGARLKKTLGGAVTFAAGFALINAFSYSLSDLERMITQVQAPGFVIDRAWLAVTQLVMAPGVFGLPVVIFGVIGAVAFVRRSPLFRPAPSALEPLLTVWIPILVAVYLILFRLDPFPRHLLALLPWVAVFAGAGFTAVQDALGRLGKAALVVPVAATAWLLLLVFDGERHFISEPRNRAAEWLLGNLPRGTPIYWTFHRLASYPQVDFPNDGATPPVIVMEMLFGNDYLSGQRWRNSMPSDYRSVFGGHNQERLLRVQALLTGSWGYHEVARFGEGYFMPELTIPLRLTGDRSRNYLTEVVVFRRDSSSAPP